MYNTQSIITLLSYVIPAFILIIPASGEIAFIVISLYSFFFCFQKKINPFTDSTSKIISFIFITYFSVALLSILASDISFYAFKRLGTNIHFLVAPWLMVFLSQNLKKDLLIVAIKIGASLAGIIACIQYFYLAQRAHGTVNALPFGDIALLLSFFSLINIHQENKIQKYLSLLSFILGCSAVIFSLARGAWITAPFLFILLLFIWYKQKSISLKLLLVFLLLGTLSIGFISLSPQVQSRIQAAQHDITRYDTNSLTSLGIRITLWKTAIRAIPDHPILGFGLHNTKQVASDYIENKTIKESMSEWSGHFHNEYLTTLVGKGAIGLASLFMLLFAPAFLLYRHLSSVDNGYQASLVFMLCTGYSLFGLTNLALGHGIMNTFFVFILATSTSLLKPTPLIVNT
jgi:O-antigen ligase